MLREAGVERAMIIELVRADLPGGLACNKKALTGLIYGNINR